MRNRALKLAGASMVALMLCAAPGVAAADPAGSGTSSFEGPFGGISASGIETSFNKNCNNAFFTDEDCDYITDYYAKNGGYDDSETSFGMGARIGYNFLAGSFLYGALVDFDYYGFGNSNVDYLIALKARIGGTVFGEGLIYATGGLAIGGFADERISYPYNAPIKGDSGALGWTVGAGYEHFVATNISIFGEFNYYRLNDVAELDAKDLGGPDEYFSRWDADIAQIKFGVHFHF